MEERAIQNPQPEPLAGVVLIDKPADRRITSMTVVRSVRRRLIAGGVATFGPNGGTSKNIKVGHAGTLDPLASGLLIVLVGKATRLCDALMAGGKAYVADVDLAHRSTTDDLEGVLTPNRVGERAAAGRVEEAVRGFVGEVRQRPPSHSAVWVDGARAYDLARAGDLDRLPERPVRIDEIRILDYAWPRLRIEVRCGKGTYIRSLARDLGVAITGSPGCLVRLRRTRIEPFGVEQARALERLPMVLTREDLIVPPAVG
ncbi:MAG: tRNA pseudouridine(55) synthase TruB [Phycisphaerales bacterium]